MAHGGEIDDPELAAAIEASYRSQTRSGLEASEDELIAQAMHLSRLEEDARQQTADGGRDTLPSTASSPPWPATAAGSGAGAYNSSGLPMPAASSSGAPEAQWLGPGAPNRFKRLEVPMHVEDDGQSSAAAVQGDSSRASSSGGSPRVVNVDGLVEEGEESPSRGVSDRHLAMAIEASYAAQTEHGQIATEDDMVLQALKISQMEEEARQRASLREQQEQELQESIFMDQMREQEEKRRKVEEEQLQELEEARLADEEKRKEDAEQRRVDEQVAKQGRVPPEPPAGEPGRVDLQVRAPDGRRLRFTTTSILREEKPLPTRLTAWCPRCRGAHMRIVARRSQMSGCKASAPCSSRLLRPSEPPAATQAGGLRRAQRCFERALGVWVLSLLLPTPSLHPPPPASES